VTVATVGIAVVALVAAGVAAGAVLLGADAPSSVASETGARVAPVSVETYDGTRRAPATPLLAEPTTLTLGAFGRVRSSACVPGAVLASGSSWKARQVTRIRSGRSTRSKAASKAAFPR